MSIQQALRGILCTAILATGLTAWGQEPALDNGTPEKNRVESRQLLEEVLIARLTSELALDDAQTVLLVRHLTAYRDRMIALRRERAEKMRALRKAVRESQDESAISAMLAEVTAVQDKYVAARKDILEFDGFEMTAWQKARLLIFLNDFENDMRKLLRRAQARRSTAGSGDHSQSSGETVTQEGDPEGNDDEPDPASSPR